MLLRSFQVAKRAQECGDEADRRLGPGHPLAECFPMIHNRAIITTEQLDCYIQRWDTTEEKLRLLSMPAGERALALKEKEERLGEVFKSMFIHLVSSVEHGLRETHRPRGKLSARELSKLKELLKATKADGWMTEADLELWSFLVTGRNWIVHNNGHADRNLETTIQGRAFRAKEGVQMQDKVDACLFFTEQATEALGRLARAVPP